VLYSTNTFHLASIVLIKHLPLLILPQRLACIKSLEMVWDLNPPADSSTYEAMTDVVMSPFLSLRKLYISINPGIGKATGEFTGFNDYFKRREQELLGPLDEMVRKKIAPKLQDCRIALPCRDYSALYHRAQRAGACIQRAPAGSLYWEQFWRTVPVKQDGQSQNEGYWVRRGLQEMPLSCTFY
jgi:hypothetical protein